MSDLKDYEEQIAGTWEDIWEKYCACLSFCMFFPRDGRLDTGLVRSSG